MRRYVSTYPAIAHSRSYVNATAANRHSTFVLRQILTSAFACGSGSLRVVIQRQPRKSKSSPMIAAIDAASQDREPVGHSVSGGGAVCEDGTTQPGGALNGREAEIRVERRETDEHCGQLAESDDKGPWHRGQRRSVAIARLLAIAFVTDRLAV